MGTRRHANTRFFRSFCNFGKTANPADGGSLLKAAFLCACTVIMLAATAPGVHAQTIMPERSTASCEGVLDTYQFSRIDDISQSGSPEPTIGLGQTFLAKETGDLARAQVLVRDLDYLAQGSMNVELRPLTSQGWPSNSEILASDVVEASEVSDGGAEWATANFGPGVKVTKGRGYALTLTPRGGTTTIGWAGNGQNICTDGDVFTSMSGGFQNYATNLAGEYTRDRYYRVFVQPPPNSAPVANNDTLQAGANQKLTVDAPGVLANDTDANGDHLTASLVQTTQHGELSLNTDGSFSYTPDEDYMGPDSFSYKASDGMDPSAVAVVEISVNPNSAPDAVDDTLAGREETRSDLAVLDNDTDPDGRGNLDPASVRVVTQPEHGTATANVDGTISYLPEHNFNGTDSFTYEVCDTGKPALCDTATTNVHVADTNDAPTPQPDEGAMAVNANWTYFVVLSNDTDPDPSGTPNGSLNWFSFRLAGGANNGSASASIERGAIAYKPNSGFEGRDYVDYTICDAGSPAKCANGRLSITVGTPNDAPNAVDDAYSVDEDETLTVDEDDGVLANDTDAQNNALTASLVEGTTNGTASLDADGSFSYTPDENFNGTDTFTYKANDGKADSASPATVTITVASTNDGPVANDDWATVEEDTSKNINVLGNDTDPDGNADLDPTSVRVVTQPEKGTATANIHGTITYEPNPDFNGSDSFTYEVCDNQGACDTATVTMTVTAVNDAPVARADSVSTPEDTPIIITHQQLLANDDAGAANENNQNLTIVEVSNPINGEVALNDDETITFTPDANYHGNGASFDYTISDGQGNESTATATVSVTVTSVNDAPVAKDDTANVNEDESVDVAVLDNDTDPDGNDDLDPASVTIKTLPGKGTAVANNDGTVTYTPNKDANGADSFTYEVCDEDAPPLCDAATVDVQITPVNDSPVATDDAATVKENGGPVDINALANDTDPDGKDDISPASVKVTVEPENGTTLVNADGTITFTPKPDFNGTDSFTYEVCDFQGACDTATVTVTVTPLDKPVDPNACTIRGTNGNDVLTGTAKRDVICGRDGDDTIRGLGGNDVLRGGYGNDTLYGNDGRDSLYGGPGNDKLIGGAGKDLLRGGAGTDIERQ